MDRRGFLIALFALLPGCTGSDNNPATETAESTAPNTTTSASTTTPTESTTETPKKTETTGPDTTTGEQQAATHLSNADDYLGAAFDEYAAFAGSLNTTFVSVTAATTSFERSPVLSHLANAKEELATAEQYGTNAQSETVSQLRDVTEFLSKVAAAQEYLIEARLNLQAASDALADGEDSKLESHLNSVEARHKSVSDMVETIREETDAASATATAHASPDQYEQKLSQFDEELSTLSAFGTQLSTCVDALAPFREAVDHTLDGNDVAAWTDYGRAEYEFGTLQDAVAGMTPADAFQELYSTVECFVDAMVDGATHLESSANAGRDDDSDKKQAEKEKAKEAFQTCEMAWMLPSVQRLFSED
jgi:hypothetical protein